MRVKARAVEVRVATEARVVKVKARAEAAGRFRSFKSVVLRNNRQYGYDYHGYTLLVRTCYCLYVRV